MGSEQNTTTAEIHRLVARDTDFNITFAKWNDSTVHPASLSISASSLKSESWQQTMHRIISYTLTDICEALGVHNPSITMRDSSGVCIDPALNGADFSSIVDCFHKDLALDTKKEFHPELPDGMTFPLHMEIGPEPQPRRKSHSKDDITFFLPSLSFNASDTGIYSDAVADKIGAELKAAFKKQTRTHLSVKKETTPDGMIRITCPEPDTADIKAVGKSYLKTEHSMTALCKELETKGVRAFASPNGAEPVAAPAAEAMVLREPVSFASIERGLFGMRDHTDPAIQAVVAGHTGADLFRIGAQTLKTYNSLRASGDHIHDTPEQLLREALTTTLNVGPEAGAALDTAMRGTFLVPERNRSVS